MADSFNNPGRQGDLDALNAALRARLAEVKANLAQAQRLSADAAAGARERDRALQREAKERRIVGDTAITRSRVGEDPEVRRASDRIERAFRRRFAPGLTPERPVGRELIERLGRTLPRVPVPPLRPEQFGGRAISQQAIDRLTRGPVISRDDVATRTGGELRAAQRDAVERAGRQLEQAVRRPLLDIRRFGREIPAEILRRLSASLPPLTAGEVGGRAVSQRAIDEVNRTGPAKPPPKSAYALPGGGIKLDPGGNLAAQLPATIERQAQLEAKTNSLNDAYRVLGTTERQLESRLQSQARASQIAGDQMRRHGLLTTEFISAAARGQTTVRELGVQIGGTIAKFAGWTGAAALTYGGLTAIQAVGTGALDSLQGVDRLNRVVNGIDTEKAQQQFRSLSREFNLPIGTVTDAAFEASKAFKDQNQILEATRAALQGVKVGELEAGAAGKFATSIIRGFKLETSDFGAVIDTVNRLQNQFGGDFGQIFQGVAGAAGSFANAKGTFQELATLIQVGSQITGKSGNELATALRRSSEIVTRPERRQTIIGLLGIDPQDSSITDIIRAGQKKVAEGADVQQIARAISTPELASGRIAPLLRAGDLFEQRLQDVIDNAAGSAKRELDIVKASPREQLAKIGVDLQQIGSAAAEAGAGHGIGVMVKALDQALVLTREVLDTMRLIPAPIREAAAAALPFLGALALAKRFDVGSALGRFGRPLRRNPEAIARAQLLQGVGDSNKFFAQQAEQSRTRSAVLSFQASRSRPRVEQATRDLERLEPGTEGYTDAKRRLDVISTRHDRILREQIDVAEDAADADERLLQGKSQERDIRRRTRFGRESAADVARSHEIDFASPIEPRPDPTGVIPLRTPGGVILPPGVKSVAADAAKAETAAATAATARTGRLAAAGRGLKAANARLLSAMAGVPFEAYILGAFGLYEFGNAVNAANQRSLRETERIKSLPRTAEDSADLRRQTDEIKRQAQVPAGKVGIITSPQLTAAREAAGEAPRLAQLNAQDKAFTREQIKQRLAKRLEIAAGDPKAAADAYQQAIKEAQSARGLLFAKTPEQRAQAENDIAEIIAATFRPRLDALADLAGNFDERLAAALDSTALGTITAGTQQSVALYGLTPKRSEKLGREASRARALVATTTDPVERGNLLKLAQDAEQSLLDAADKRLQDLLTLARTPRQRRAARREYLGSVRDFYAAGEQDRENVRARLRREKATRDLLLSERTRGGDALGRGAILIERNRAQALAQLKAKIDLDADKLRELNAQGKQNKTAERATRLEVRRDNADERLDAFDARTARLESEARTPRDAANVVAERLRQRTSLVRALVRKKILTSADLDRAITDQNNAEKQAAEDLQSQALERLQALQERSSASLAAGGALEGTLLRKSLSDAVAYANKVKSVKGADSIEFIQAQTGIFQAQKALADFLRSQAEDLVNANAELASSRTTNPVTLALIQLRRDQQLLKTARTPAEKIRLRASINVDRRNVAESRLADDADDIQFALDMGRIEADSAARRFRQLAAQVKNNKALRRDYLRRAKALEDQDSGALNIGIDNIRLPTPYEVNRIIREGRRAGSRPIVQQNAVTLAVTVSGDRAGGLKVIEMIDANLGTSGSSAMRAQGVNN